MNGETLYNTWRNKMAELGVECDQWHELADTDREAWDATAATAHECSRCHCGQ
jgi:hypothetical protein